MKLAVIGAGSWGTALAIQLARAGNAVKLWGRDRVVLEAARTERVNARYLPNADFPDGLVAEPDWTRALDEVDGILVSVPSHAFRQVLEDLALLHSIPDAICWATKGLEIGTGLLPHQVVGDVLPGVRQQAALSGPTFATEVGQGLPTAITIASEQPDYAAALVQAISSPSFRAYSADDLVGVEIGGAVKNVLAIGAGLSDGLGFGANARVALINRGLREMMRLGTAMGARAETFFGLACMGDLVLTCTDDQSRNRRMGLGLAAGRSAEEIAADMGQVVEGVTAARAVHEHAHKLGVELPIVNEIHAILYEGKSATSAVRDLMSRATGAESP